LPNNRPILVSSSSSSVCHSRRRTSDSDGGSRRPRPVRIPPSNPEELEAARRGEWNYEKGIIETKDDEEGVIDEPLEY